MTSFLSSFTSTPSLSALAAAPPPQLEISITPSSSAYYAGEAFSARISFRNAGSSSHTSLRADGGAVAGDSSGSRKSLALSRSRSPPGSPRPRADNVGSSRTTPVLSSAPLLGRADRHSLGQGLDEEGEAFTRYRQVGRHVPDTPLLGSGETDELDGGYEGNAEAGPSGPRYDQSAEGTQEWLDEAAEGTGELHERQMDRIKSLGHARRSKSLAMGGGVSPQEMVRALGGAPPPSLPSRRPRGTGIPRAHPHSRQMSIAQPPMLSPTLSDAPPLPNHAATSARSARPPLSRMTSASSTSSSVTEGNDIRSAPLPSHTRQQLAKPASTPSAYITDTTHPPPPPTHPQARAARDAQATCTILWAYTRLVATFHPSITYIPPDPLLPLRSLLLHQPIGSGSLLPASSKGAASSGSRWQMSFGTGALPGQSAPSLTGSLVGLASSLLSSGQGGSLEQERKKVWNTKDLPVLETARSLIGVEMKLGEGESREYDFSMQVPQQMPPSHVGKAWAFEWKMVVNVGVKLGREERVEEVVLPIRVWSRVSLSSTLPLYNVLDPRIQQRDEARVEEPAPLAALTTDGLASLQSAAKGKPEPRSQAALSSYAQQLLDTTPKAGRHAPPSPARMTSPSAVRQKRDRTVTGSTLAPVTWNKHDLLSDSGSIVSARRRTRRGSGVHGDDDLADGGTGGSAEAVELLSRHSAKATFDIAKSGDLVAVLTLPKTTFRLGESILGVVDINHPLSNRHGSGRRVLKMSALLESHETIPTALLPLSPRGGLSPQPRLIKVHAEYHAGYTPFNTRMSFEMDVPGDVTPGYTFTAEPKGNDGATGQSRDDQRAKQRHAQDNHVRRNVHHDDEEEDPNEPGGLSYSLRLAFLVASPPSEEGLPPGHRHGSGASSVVPNAKDGDNGFFTATDGLAPVVPVLRRTVADEGDKAKMDLVGYDEMAVETVQCEIPVRVLPGAIGEGEGVSAVL